MSDNKKMTSEAKTASPYYLSDASHVLIDIIFIISYAALLVVIRHFTKYNDDILFLVDTVI
jgi:hypothetical protein